MAGLALMTVAAAAVSFLAVAPPTELIREHVVAEIKARTGRDIEIAGPASLTFFPALGVSLSAVSLSAPLGMNAPPTVTMSRLDVSVALWPLLSRQFVIERLVLGDPIFDIRTDRTGRRSWEFAATSGPSARIKVAQAGGGLSDLPLELKEFVRGSSAQGERDRRLPRLAFGDVRIENGTIEYRDERSGLSQRISAINLTLSLDDVAGPMTAVGTATLHQEPFTIDARLTSLERLTAGDPVRLDAKLAGRPAEVAFDGTIAAAGLPSADGSLRLQAKSVAALAGFSGGLLPTVTGLQTLDVKGRLKAAGKIAMLSDLEAMLDGTRATGTVTADVSGTRPLLRANLDLSELNLNRWLSTAEPGTAAPAVRAVPTPASGTQKSIGDLLRDTETGNLPATRVQGFQRRAGWSDESFQLAALDAVDLEVRLNVGNMQYRDLQIGRSQLQVELKDRVLRTIIDDMLLYEGRGHGVVTLNATMPVATMAAEVTLDGVAAFPLLKDAAQFDWLTGRGRLAMTISGQGNTERQIMQALSGKGDFAVNDGALIGYDIPKLIRGLGQGRIGNVARATTEKTEFTSLSASFTIAGGVARNSNLKLTSPHLHLSGAGTVDLGLRQLDYTLRPKLVAAASSQSSTGDLAGLELPVKIVGSWERPTLTPDLGAVLQNPNKTVEAVKEIGKQLNVNGRNAEEAVRDLLKGGQSADGQKIKPRKLLDQLLNR